MLITKLYPLAVAPVDYQQLWLDMLSSTFDEVDIDSIVLECELKPVADFRAYLLEAMTDWLEHDLSIVVGMSSENVLSRLPPLVHTNGFLNDGYHRVAACMLTGVVDYHCVNLSDVVKKLKNRETHEKSDN